MKIDAPEFQSIDPFRKPDWRAQRARELLRSPHLQPSRRYDDEHTREYYAFLKAERRSGRRPAAMLELFRSAPGLYLAHYFRHHPDPEWRVLLEAHLLARRSDQEIADEFGTSPAVVACYERLFFHVRDRLDNRTYIVKTVLGPEMTRVAGYDDFMTDTLRHLTYKVFAYYGGPLVLDVMVSGFEQAPLPGDSTQLGVWFDTALQTAIRRRSVPAAMFGHVNRFNTMELLGLHARFIEQALAARGGQSQAGIKYEQHVLSFLEGQQVVLGDAEQPRAGRLGDFETTAIEPRADEQLGLLGGQVSASMTRRLELAQALDAAILVQPATATAETVDV